MTVCKNISWLWSLVECEGASVEGSKMVSVWTDITINPTKRMNIEADFITKGSLVDKNKIIRYFTEK